MNPHKKEESSFCLCVWLPVSGVLTPPQVLIFPSGWQLADYSSLKIPEKKRSNYAWGSTKYHGLLEEQQSVGDQLGC